MDQKTYNRRSLVETVISALKRKYGDVVSSRVWWRQELVATCVAYNVERAVKLGMTSLDLLRSRLLYSFQWRISTEPPLLLMAWSMK